MIRARFHWQRRVLFLLFAIVTLAVATFGFRTYRSFLLLYSAYELGAPDVSSVRPWMTMDYVTRAYGLPELALAERLGLPLGIDPSSTLKSLAQRQGVSPFQYLRQVQEALSQLHPISPPSEKRRTDSDSATLGDQILAALLLYGYPVLGMTLLLGAIGAPFPCALSVVVAASLAAQGQLSLFWTSAIAIASTVLGDLAGYGLGRVLGQKFFERRGRWLRFTPAVRARVELLFQQWGILSILLSRSLLSFLSSTVNLLAGAGRYRLRVFVPFAIAGRLIWTSAYLCLGYGIGAALEAAADFTSNMSGLLFSLIVLIGLGFMIYRNNVRLRSSI